VVVVGAIIVVASATADDRFKLYSSIYYEHERHLMFVIKLGRVGFEPTTPAMSRRYLNQARPPAQTYIISTIFVNPPKYIRVDKNDFGLIENRSYSESYD
jgi:hypothetical protein